MKLSLRPLRYFLAAAENGQISLAAASLNVAQSTVTTALQHLEREVGANLFRRLPSGVELTVEGSRFLAHARNILEAVSLAERAPLSETARLAGVVRVAVTTTAAGYFLPPPMTRFARAYPEIRLDLTELSRPEIEHGLARDRFDLAVAQFSEGSEPDGPLAWETLLRSRRRLWTAADHPLLAAHRIDFAEVARVPFVTLAADEEDRVAAGFWRLAGLSPKATFTTASVEAARNLVAEGFAVTILPDLLYRPFSLDGRRVEQRPLADAAPTLELGLCWRKERAPSPAARALMEFLSRSAGGGA